MNTKWMIFRVYKKILLNKCLKIYFFYYKYWCHKNVRYIRSQNLSLLCISEQSTFVNKDFIYKTVLAFIFIPINNFNTLPERPPSISDLVKSTETSLKFVLSVLLLFPGTVLLLNIWTTHHKNIKKKSLNSKVYSHVPLPPGTNKTERLHFTR